MKEERPTYEATSYEVTYHRFKCRDCQGFWIEHYLIPLRLAKCPYCDSQNCAPIEGM